MSKKKNIDFEATLDELEKVVSAMEEESIPLKDLLKYYEKGNQLIEDCESSILSARKQLETIKAKTTATPAKPANNADQDDDEIRLF